MRPSWWKVIQVVSTVLPWTFLWQRGICVRVLKWTAPSKPEGWLSHPYGGDPAAPVSSGVTPQKSNRKYISQPNCGIPGGTSLSSPRSRARLDVAKTHAQPYAHILEEVGHFSEGLSGLLNDILKWNLACVKRSLGLSYWESERQIFFKKAFQISSL